MEELQPITLENGVKVINLTGRQRIFNCGTRVPANTTKITLPNKVINVAFVSTNDDHLTDLKKIIGKDIVMNGNIRIVNKVLIPKPDYFIEVKKLIPEGCLVLTSPAVAEAYGLPFVAPVFSHFDEEIFNDKIYKSNRFYGVKPV